MNEERADVDWVTARSVNLENWEDRVPLHEQSYGISAFDDPAHLSGVVRTDLAALAPHLPGGTISGLAVCHLQCHIGTDTVSLARAGATVTGVDFSPAALRSAAAFAERLGVAVRWIEGDVLEARSLVEGDFDLVYTSIGTITWLPDLSRWARQISALLRPGGTFYIRDGHPALYALDEHADVLHVRYPYFNTGDAQVWDETTTYSGDGVVAHSRTFQWAHSISEIVSALLEADLQIIGFDEGRTLPWRFSSRMDPVDGGFAWPEAERDLVPCTYTIVARRVGD